MARTDFVGTFKILHVHSFTVLAPCFVSVNLTYKLRFVADNNEVRHWMKSGLISTNL